MPYGHFLTNFVDVAYYRGGKSVLVNVILNVLYVKLGVIRHSDMIGSILHNDTLNFVPLFLSFKYIKQHFLSNIVSFKQKLRAHLFSVSFK